MHTLSLSQSVIDRVTHRRGKPHIYDELDPRRTALVVVDMQNAFLMEGVGHAVCPEAREIVPNINRLARSLRDAGGTVVWIKTTADPQTPIDWSVYYGLVGPGGAAERAAALAKDSVGHALWSELAVEPNDLIVEKRRYSAFIQGSSDLAEVLRGRGIDTIVITGTVTNVCCESTARDAMMLNFRTIMVTDGNAAMTDEEHNASLRAFYLSFGDILSTDRVIASLRRKATRPGIAAE